jgi:hypothetical protein
MMMERDSVHKLQKKKKKGLSNEKLCWLEWDIYQNAFSKCDEEGWCDNCQ